MTNRTRVWLNLRLAAIGMLATLTLVEVPASARALERPPEELPSVAAFAKLSLLVGEWKGIGETRGDTLTYTLIANGSTLMEEARPAGDATMVTMFTVDGDHLLATHYCSARNQPHMTTAAIGDRDPRAIVFTLVRVTGLKTAGDWHNTGLEMILEDKDHLTERWTYLANGKRGTNVFRFERAGVSPSGKEESKGSEE